VTEGVLEAFGPDFAAVTDAFRLLRRSAALRKEEVGIDAEAVRSLLPAPVFGYAHGVEHLDDVPHRLLPSYQMPPMELQR